MLQYLPKLPRQLHTEPGFIETMLINVCLSQAEAEPPSEPFQTICMNAIAHPKATEIDSIAGSNEHLQAQKLDG
jgi:hypothetical protein